MSRQEQLLQEDLSKVTNLPNKRTQYFLGNEIEIPKSTLVMLCGTPGAGKTTLANRIHRKIQNSILISMDELFEEGYKELFNSSKILTQEDGNKIIRWGLENGSKEASEVLQNEGIVIWDDLTIFPTDRQKILNALEGRYQNSILIVIDLNIITALSRSIDRGDTAIRTFLIPDTYKCLQLQLQEAEKYFVGVDRVYIIDGTREIKIKEP